MSGISDRAIADRLKVTPAVPNAWRKNLSIPQQRIPFFKKLLERYLQRTIDQQGFLIDDFGAPVMEPRNIRALIEHDGHARREGLSSTWKAHRDLILAIEKLGENDSQIANALGYSAATVAIWRRAARIPNALFSDVLARCQIATQYGSAPRQESPIPDRSEPRITKFVEYAEISRRWLQLIDAVGKTRAEIADCLGMNTPTVVAWFTRGSVPRTVRPKLASILGPMLGVELAADGLFADGQGRRLAWGEPSIDTAADSPGADELRDICRWVDDQIAKATTSSSHARPLREEVYKSMREAAERSIREFSGRSVPRSGLDKKKE